MDTRPYFSSLVRQLSDRASRATLSRLAIRNEPLRRYLESTFVGTCGRGGSFLSDPVFEAKFGWKTAGQTIEALASELLPTAVVDALNEPPPTLRDEYRLGRTLEPYTHQVESWRTLAAPEPKSVVVTSGTGSGKTECFLVPIISSLARQLEKQDGPLVGVQALLLYPLNALINSQRDRLRAWTHPFGTDLRFCLYNGNTREQVPAHDREEWPSQVLDRQTLRASPPPILVTNATMLEYMLVRAQDAPIVNASKGKLRWIVLDEAHTYVGSQAAELALLLRRVMHAFGVEASGVRFVATSATIGGGATDSLNQLRDYLADLAGIGPDQVHVVTGSRAVPEIKPANASQGASDLDQLAAIDRDQVDSASRYAALESNATARRIRALFTPPAGTVAVPLSDIVDSIGLLRSERDSPAKALAWLDLLSGTAKPSPSGAETFLPLRAHLFHQVFQGVWACADRRCARREGTALADGQWPYGQVYLEERRRCDCGAPVYELRSCEDCSSTYLFARIVESGGQARLLSVTDAATDEFAIDLERSDEAAEEPGQEDADSVTERLGAPVLITNTKLGGASAVQIDCDTLVIEPKNAEKTISITALEASPSEEGEEELACPNPVCKGKHSLRRPLFRRLLLGAPFFLGSIVPTTLEFCPDAKEALKRPSRGRRMISFTDSRQGTARLAAKVQQDSERNRIRGLVNARVRHSATSESPELGNQKKLVEDLKRFVADGGESAKPMLAEQEARLAEMARRNFVSFNDTADWLATNESDLQLLQDYYADLAPDLFAGDSGRGKLARMLLLRELARRPRRVNSLETMGFVRLVYPGLEQVKEAPSVLTAPGCSLADWRDFLKICLDFFVRENSYIDLPDHWRQWGGQRIARKWLLSPVSKEAPTSQIRRWPQTRPHGQQQRLARLLALLLKLDLTDSTDRDTIDLVLRCAWDQLAAAGLLTLSGGDKRFLSFDDVALAPVRDAWLCPFMNRVLDVTFRGVTPYLPSDASDAALARAEPIVIPEFDGFSKDYPSEAERLAAIRDWLETAPAVQALRARGVWSDISDRVVEGGAYFRAAEHSAQQPAARLENYERLFKEGRLNLLSCSTTMEMGVDIGGVAAVAMTNVPPHPANYLQRAGRAGRRGESRAIAVTLCKNNPHDQYVFENPLWPFVTQLHAPTVSLSSHRIVQRHINALLLSDFLKLRAGLSGTDLTKLTCASFFLPLDSALAEAFKAWCLDFSDERDPVLSRGLRSLMRRTPFEGAVTLAPLVGAAADAMLEAASGWRLEQGAVAAQLEPFKGKKEEDVAFRALTAQLKRLEGEYLLSELATRGFLPGHGFPTDLVSLDTLTRFELAAKKARKQSEGSTHREDNLYRRRDLATRDMATGLREYSPGAEVVIDGLVFRSAGVTLNWHAPTSDAAAREIQSLRTAWRCRTCGASGTTPSGLRPSSCIECGGANLGFSAYLEPSGFAVDLYVDPHNDVSAPEYIPVERPWVHAEGVWVPLPNRQLGRFKVSEAGSVYHQSSGLFGRGYAVCLECGRAEPMPPDSAGSDAASLPAVFREPHRRLRGAQGGETSTCEGSHRAWAIKRGLNLGHQTFTDILEIQLRGLNGETLTDRAVAFSLAVALRSAIADELGIEVTELGCDVRQARSEDGGLAQSIFVFDHGAAGYASSVGPRISSVLARAAELLKCPAECDSACQHCLLQFDTRFEFDLLDRHAARGFLSDQWLRKLVLPDEQRHFGESSVQEVAPLSEAVARELLRGEVSAAAVMLSGEPSEWDLSAAALRRALRRLGANEKPLHLVLAKPSFAKLDQDQKHDLGLLAATGGASVSLTDAEMITKGGSVLAAVQTKRGATAWASADSLAGSPNESWGTPSSEVLVRGSLAEGWPSLQKVDLAALRPSVAHAKAIEVELSDELDGVLNGFGGRFWGAIEERWPSLRDFLDRRQVRSVLYSDRYLSTPLAVAILLEIVHGMKTRCGSSWNADRVKVHAAEVAVDETRRASFVSSNWPRSKDRDDALRSAFDYCGLEADLSVLDKRNLPHARSLVVFLDGGMRLTVRPDQGMGYWSTRSRAGSGWGAPPFDFGAPPKQQGERIANLAVAVQGQTFPTYLFCTLEQ